MNLRTFLALAAAGSVCAAEPPEPKFRAETIDAKIQIGYGVAVADVDGDKRPDILLADKKQFVWYQNPGVPPPGAATFAAPIWSKFVIAENLTKHDNVCLAAQDIDGDGKCEIAVGAEWNPSDTETSGAVFYMIPPADRQEKWTPVKLHAEPTTHRMRWIKLGDGKWGLVVVPLHGRGNKNGEGAGVKVLLYHPPAERSADGPSAQAEESRGQAARAPARIDPQGEWKTELIDESMHMTHNFVDWRFLASPYSDLTICGKEGGRTFLRVDGVWKRYGGGFPKAIDGVVDYRGAGEIRLGLLKGRKVFFYVAVEPMHGNQLVVYFEDGSSRRVLTEKLTEGHALACGDVLGVGSDQIVVGWRGKPGVPESTIGVAVWTALDPQGEKWRETIVDGDGMACEDLVLADLDADGDLDIVASGRATKNLRVYYNETPR